MSSFLRCSRSSALILALTCAPVALTGRPQEQPPRIDDFAWLAGGWRCQSDDVVTEEHWIPPAGRTMLAIGRTVRGEHTLFFEFLRLEARKDGLYYVAHPGGRSPGTDFKLTSWDGKAAVFENPDHDFPQVIRYTREGADKLVARVEGKQGDKPASQDYTYERIAK